MKRELMTRKKTYQCGPTVRIVYKDNFKNFFQMTMIFLVCVVTILRKLLFMRNYFFTVNISTEQLLPQSNTTATFSEQLLLQSSYLLGVATYSEHSLLLSSYFQNSYLFGAKHLPTSNFL